MNFYSRNIYAALSQHLNTKQITVLTGMRRTGKTTLVKQLMQDTVITQKYYFDLERMDNRTLFSEPNYETIIYALTQQGANFKEKVLIAIDEIQLVPNLPSVLKYLYDTYDIKFIVTGSSAYYMKNMFSESLAGRKKLFEVYPLSFNELLSFNGIIIAPLPLEKQGLFVKSEYERLKNYYETYINYGGFPEVVLATSIAEKSDMIQDIISSYINFDIALLSDIRNPANLYKLMRLLAVRIGTKLDVSKLTSLTGISRPTVENYLDLLEQSYLIRTIPVLSKSPDREITKARKIYFLDNGIASASAEAGSGALFENAVFNQLLHHGDIAYYQLKTGKEIDFILNGEICFEVKETATEADLRNLKAISGNLAIDKGYVIGRHPAKLFDGYIWGGFIQHI
ncbi:ATP-binding protein [Pedobacter sp. MC2016-24]|uniref:ATP-binding protein n=1 Tax=Pedobacter sp. MC2016-24 TaxID=2780090 RepID=UPI00187F0501|nr:ATP-binding protein [Pedobacter sp. MC2016-24]MBE9599386.1 ATP-binding protein [Pedobacter sp. MC2016-24]